jgi:hypothetical protein
MLKNHSVWCTERFFLASSRDFDWDACLWQLWLDSFGDVSFLQIPDWTDGQPVVLPMNSAAVRRSAVIDLFRTAETWIEQTPPTSEL